MFELMEKFAEIFLPRLISMRTDISFIAASWSIVNENFHRFFERKLSY
jgi:hypothetical protein